MSTILRKAAHIDICMGREVQFKEKKTGFDDVELIYNALPEINFDEVSIETSFLGKKFSAPLMVSSMSGGAERSKKLNRDIALACEELGLGMGLGSQRAIMEDPATLDSFQVRDIAPSMFLSGNLGATQLRDSEISRIEDLLSATGADALAIHINPAQEVLQFEGTPQFSGCVEQIKKVSEKLSKPVIVKEVGCGISKGVAELLNKTKVKAIDVAGAGGTSWTGVEIIQSGKSYNSNFWDFGIPTVPSLIECDKVFKGHIVASGGIRSGLDVVKSIALGADMAGIAYPVLMAQNVAGYRGVKDYLSGIIRETKMAMFMVGAKSVEELKGREYVLLGKTKQWVDQRE